ncbi:MAG: hypothetical protein L0Z62_37400 [Gemmataceae bacterium]|nr:hypothetical protein [Gemmataceae bacterium]
MPYRTRILPLAGRQIRSWGLSDFVVVEVYLRLTERLANQPAQQMYPSAEPDGGMLYQFSVIDPENRLCEHTFQFRVYYHPDETTLLVTSGIYRRQVGM